MPIYMRIDGIKGDVVETDHDRWTELTSFSSGAHKGGGGNTGRDDVIIDGRIITGENPSAARGEGRPMETMSLNFTKVEFDAALPDGAGGALVGMGDGSVRMTTTDFDLF